MTKIIFFGNGPLADFSKAILEKHFDIVFHARTKEDLETVKEIKKKDKDVHGVLASFGVMIKSDVLGLFEPEGILNIHPSLLPKYRGASPIETAILSGDEDFSVSIMKLVKAMDAGPIYYQTTFKNLAGANWLVKYLENLPEPTPQNEDEATFTTKFDKSMSLLTPETDTAEKTFRKIVAFENFPKAKYVFYGKECIILKAHLSDSPSKLSLKCQDGKFVDIDILQPAGKKPMDQKSFLNGYAK